MNLLSLQCDNNVFGAYSCAKCKIVVVSNFFWTGAFAIFTTIIFTWNDFHIQMRKAWHEIISQNSCRSHILIKKSGKMCNNENYLWFSKRLLMTSVTKNVKYACSYKIRNSIEINKFIFGVFRVLLCDWKLK